MSDTAIVPESMIWLSVLSALVLGYLFGSIPFGVIYEKAETDCSLSFMFHERLTFTTL